VLDVDLFAQYLLNGQISPLDQPPMRIEYRSSKKEQMSDSDIAFEDMESCGMKSAVFNEREITCYTQLCSKSGSDVKVTGGNSPMDMLSQKGRDGGSKTTVSLMKGSYLANDREITCYTQFYSKPGSDKKVTGRNRPMDMLHQRGRDGSSQTTASLTEGSYLAFSISTSCTQDNGDSGLPLLSGESKAIIDLGILHSDYEN